MSVFACYPSTDTLKNGWFIGNFLPTALKTHGVEACARWHMEGEKWPKHFHEHSYEVNLLKEGQMSICGKKLCGNDIFIIEPNEIADLEEERGIGLGLTPVEVKAVESKE